MTAGDPRKTARWQNLRRKLIAAASHCALCGAPLIPAAPPRSRWSSTIDHIVPVALGGPAFDPANLRVAHYGCNSSRGAQLRNGTNYPPSPHTVMPPITTTRRWWLGNDTDLKTGGAA